MAKYYSLMLSKNISKTGEGYLICENVPLCRSGFQEYLGEELVGFDGYEESWGLVPTQRYKVFRPKDSVLDPDFIKSLEGKTVVDEHPDGNVVHLDNDQELNCGHVENVKEGPVINGEVTLQGDLHIKNIDLINKVRPEDDPDNEHDTATRDVSLGYGLWLKRLDDGTIIMYRLRGNHVAVVEKGRAGPRIAIKDSALPEIITKAREPYMDLTSLFLGRGVKSVLPDASPEETAALIKGLGSKTANDAEPEKKEDIHPAHKCLDSCLKAMTDGNMDAMEFHKKELLKHLGHEDKAADAEPKEKLEELKDKAGDAELEQEEKTAAEEDDKTENDAEPKEEDEEDKSKANDEMRVDDKGKSVLKAANDSVLGYIRNSRPIVAELVSKPKSKRTGAEQIMIDSYNDAVRKVNAGKNNYSVLRKTRIPAGIPALVVVDAAIKEEKTCSCFDGVPYRKGLEKHNATCMKENN
jgi:hypothetical protein